jgi:hypoxanthine phosphoribosyltransferase
MSSGSSSIGAQPTANNAMGEPLVEGETISIGEFRFRRMITAEEIGRGIARVAVQLTGRYAGVKPVVLCVLNGAALFHADLIRQMPFPLEVDYMRVASYHGGLSSTGTLNFTAEPGTQIRGRNVIVVEDIVDSGRTVESIRDYCINAGAESVEVATLLYKRQAHQMGAPPEYAAFEIPDRFVIGFGLDYRNEGRNLPAVYVLDESASVE